MSDVWVLVLASPLVAWLIGSLIDQTSADVTLVRRGALS